MMSQGTDDFVLCALFSCRAAARQEEQEAEEEARAKAGEDKVFRLDDTESSGDEEGHQDDRGKRRRAARSRMKFIDSLLRALHYFHV